MNSIAHKFGIKESFKNWLQDTDSSYAVTRFRKVFAAIWLTYDLIDLTLGGSQAPFWFYADRTVTHQIVACQVGLILCELSLLFDFKPRRALVLAFLLRGFEAYLFPLNDYIYYCVTALLLAHFDSSFLGKKGQGQVWVRDLMVWETAWIYFSTAFLKLNPSWLTGGDLYSRQMFQISSHNWPYPSFYKNLVSGLPMNAILAWMAVAGEFSLALVLGYWCLAGKRKHRVSLVAGALVISIHGFAAIMMNVWFFSASMMAQVLFLTSGKISDENQSKR
ncbi:MAG: hypothetical protein ABIQ95_08155 [Bdellovibrionia bacterium]